MEPHNTTSRAQNYIGEPITKQVGNFEIAIQPYAGPPENRFDDRPALQYGADFMVQFMRNGEHRENLGIIQLIFPSTPGIHATPHVWNVDKLRPEDGPFPMAQCRYGYDGQVGPHSPMFEGRPVRTSGTNRCTLIDTPREFNAQFEKGIFNGNTTTKFANYVVNLNTGKVFDGGMIWGYSIHQSSLDPNRYEAHIQDPQHVSLSKSNEHLDAIGRFLHIQRQDVLKQIEEPVKQQSLEPSVRNR